MVITARNSDSLQILVKQVAENELLSRYHHARVMGKADGSLVTDADLMIQQELTRLLAERWPNIAMLGEEMTLEQQSAVLNKERFWCLDPLDGTSNFTCGLPYFAISLALIEYGQVTSAVVFDPVRNECFRADKGEGAWLNNEPLRVVEPPKGLAQCLAMIDFKRLPSALASQLVMTPPYRSQRNFGAIALEWCWLAEGRAQLYLHGGQKLWDYAAGRLVFLEAKGAVAFYPPQNEGALSLEPVPAIAAVNETLLANWSQWLRDAGYPS